MTAGIKVGIDQVSDLAPLWNEESRRARNWLYGSQMWLETWWQHFGSGSSLQVLSISKAFERAEDLVLFHSHSVRIGAGLHLRRCELVGNHWQQSLSAPAEYASFPTAMPLSADDVSAIIRTLLDSFEWHELVICRIRVDSQLWNGILRAAAEQELQVFNERENSSYFIDRSSNWSNYLQSLSGSTRRKIWHQRNSLASRLTFREITESDEIRKTISFIEGAIEKRFGRAESTDKINSFFRDVFKKASLEGGLRLTGLYLDATMISGLACIEYGTDVFFLRLGFCSAVQSGFSPGLVHLGFAIEDSMGKPGKFWLLSGPGKIEDYKAKLGQPKELGTLRIIRSPIISNLLRAKRAIGAIKSYVS